MYELKEKIAQIVNSYALYGSESKHLKRELYTFIVDQVIPHMEDKTNILNDVQKVREIYYSKELSQQSGFTGLRIRLEDGELLDQKINLTYKIPELSGG